MKKQSVLVLSLAAALVFTACADRIGAGSVLQQRDSTSAAVQDTPQTSATSETAAEESYTAPAAPEQEGPDYIASLVQETIAEFAQPGMSEFELVKAAFDYMIENTTLVDPVGLDLWRIRGDYREPPSFVENRSLSVLLFHAGKCEDYAAALTLLLQGMGLEAEYVPGLTYSTQGELVDHAWAVVRVDGVWYHVDCQLEQNISRHGSIRYKYFMRSDATMRDSHRWGQNLIDSRLLTSEQNEEIAQSYIPPACPQDYPTPERHSFTPADAPDLSAIEAEIADEFRQYEAAHGPLKPLELNVIPPVFALEGYGPQD